MMRVPFQPLAAAARGPGHPLAASIQWDLVQAGVEKIKPAHVELIRQAAQGDVLYNDDTGARILEPMGQRVQQALLEASSDGFAIEQTIERRGLFTSGIVSTVDGQRIALFFTGRKHAGENLADVLGRLAAELGPPIQMCDALSRNLPAELETILANCMAHARRKFVDVSESFPAECRHMLESGFFLEVQEGYSPSIFCRSAGNAFFGSSHAPKKMATCEQRTRLLRLWRKLRTGRPLATIGSTSSNPTHGGRRSAKRLSDLKRENAR